MKFLCKKEHVSEGTSEQDLVDIKQEPTDEANSETSCDDSAESIKTEIKDEILDTEESSAENRAAKMRKLVIKTDGMNFRSSFKRVSLDSSRSDIEDQFSQDRSMNSDASVSMDVDDEDTNDYSNDKFENLQDEDERAVLAISSAEDSQNTQIDSSLDVYNIDNSLSQNSGDNSDHFFKQRRNFDVAKDSALNHDTDPSKNVKKPNDFSVFSRHSSVEEKKTYIPKSLSNKSIASSITETEDSDMEDKFCGFQPMTDSLADKYGMYQPITESLTDSEENSYYSADNTADQQSMMNDDDDLQVQGHWNKTKKGPVESDEESDPEVKAQMESAINSILSLNQGATNEPDALYSYSSKSSQFFNQDSQSNSLYSDSNSLQADLDNFQTDLSQSRSKVAAENSKTTGENFSSDLDAAVNSILM